MYLLIALIIGIVASTLSFRGGIVSMIVSGIAGMIFGFITAYFGLPVFRFGFMGIFWIGLVAILSSSFGALFGKNDADAPYSDELLYLPKKTHANGTPFALCAWLLVLIVTSFFTTSGFINWQKYRNLIGEINMEAVFSEDTVPIDPEQMRDVDQHVAYRVGATRLGQEPGLGSKVEIRKMTIQKIRGKLYWIGALEHTDFFRWWNGKEGTPGYIRVSAIDENDAELIQKTLDGENILMKYNMGSAWGDNPHRYLYSKGYRNVGLSDFTLEIEDETDRPFLVVTKFQKKVGFSGNDATGVITLDVQTGEINDYNLDEIPEWIDRVYPENFVVQQLDLWGHYVHGWTNSFLGTKDVIKTTPGTSIIYGADGNAKWYSGLTSIGADHSTTGFVLVDTRTKEARFYKMPGATEQAAQLSIQGAVQEKEYVASMPLPYNINGQPVYYATLKDQAGLVKERAFCAVSKHQIVDVGKDRRTALRDFMSKISGTGNSIVPENLTQMKKILGKVIRFQADVRDGNTLYYIQLDVDPQKVFIGSSNIGVELPMTQITDPVAITFDEGTGDIIDIVKFDNMLLSIKERH
jgi:hypothetical protein